MSFICILVSVISASYYLKIVKVLMHDNDNINNNNIIISNSSNYIISNYHSFLISSLTLLILLFFLKPSLILNSTQLLALTLFNF